MSKINLERLLPEYSGISIEPEKFKIVLMERILEHGTREEVRWLFSIFPPEIFREFLAEHGSRRLSRRSLNFWSLFFELPLPPRTENRLWKS